MFYGSWKTASALAEERQRCLDAGMDGFLSKPVRLDALREAVERAAANSSKRAVGQPRPPTSRSALE